MWQDADLVIRMWKKGKLTEVFTYEDKEQGKEEDCYEDILEKEKKVLSVNKEPPNNPADTTDSGRYKKNISSLCCTVM